MVREKVHKPVFLALSTNADVSGRGACQQAPRPHFHSRNSWGTYPSPDQQILAG